jgi:hypothetical protein
LYYKSNRGGAAELDKKYIGKNGQPLGGRAKGVGVNRDQIMNGKLNNLSMFNLDDDLVVKHHRITAGNNPGIPTGDYTSTTGVTSKDKTAEPIINWLLGEIKKGEDVEMIYGGSSGVNHMVTITGGGTILGMPWVAIQDDAVQGWSNAQMSRGTSYRDGGKRFTWLKTDTNGNLFAAEL